MVDDKTAGEVEEQAPVAHPHEFRLAKKAPVARPAVDVQRDDVDRLEEFVQRRATFRVTEGQFVRRVVEPDRHPEPFRQH